MVFCCMHERYPYFHFNGYKSWSFFPTAKFLLLFTIMVHLLAAVLYAGQNVTSTCLLWIGKVPWIPVTRIAFSSPSAVNFSNKPCSAHVWDEPMSHKSRVFSWDPALSWILFGTIARALLMIVRFVSSLLSTDSTNLTDLWSNRMWTFSHPSLQNFRVLQSLIWWLPLRNEKQKFLFLPTWSDH